jgi:RimJ/RimL family protein N-acetyltransferase
MGQNMMITTKRLNLHTVLPDEYLMLQQDLTHPDLWRERGFTDPLRYFATNPNPLEYRAPRVAVLKQSSIIIASAGFHNAPDAAGMIEIGFGVDKTYQNLGYGQEILHGMWSWVVSDPQVKTLRYTVSPENLVSLHIIKKLNFNLIGEQIDEKDGLELIYELSSENYLANFLGKSS